MLEEQIFDTAIHDRDSFNCGNEQLNVFLKKFAAQQVGKGITVVYVLVDSIAPAEILGYYTLSAAEIDTNQISDVHKKKLPRYPVPCIRLGRLAVDQKYKGKGYGKLLIGCAVSRCVESRKQIGVYAMVVDAKDENAREFYQYYGFIPFQHADLKLYLPLGK